MTLFILWDLCFEKSVIPAIWTPEYYHVGLDSIYGIGITV